MMLIKKIVFLSVLVFLPLMAAESPEFGRQRMLGDLEFIKNTFLTCYAPLEFKTQRFGWDLNKEISVASKAVKAKKVPTLKEYQALLGQFFSSLHDHHVAIEFFSTELAVLPFIVRHAGDRYFITHIDEEFIDAKHPFPFSIGDEIMLFDEKPVRQAIAEIIKKQFYAYQGATNHALAEIYLTTRQGRLGHVVPKGTVKILGVKKETAETIEAELEWAYHPEEIKSIYSAASKKMARMAVTSAQIRKQSVANHPFFKKQLLIPHYETFKQARVVADQPSDMIGAKVSYLPPLGEYLWEVADSEEFHAYLFELSNKQRAGYVRIPSYKPQDVDKAVKDFAGIMDYFQKEADVLVIDQLNNPGGLILYMYTLVSMLTDRPLVVPQHRQVLTQEDVFFALSEKAAYEAIKTDEDARDLLGDTVAGMPVNAEVSGALLSYYNFIIDAWNSGRKITELGNVYGIGPITPHAEIRFTKPILVLTNAMDFSGADFFPAIMQDNQRATIMGVPTAGAGGILGKAVFPNLNGIAEISYTTSLAERPGGVFIEDQGVIPDIFYEHSAIDFQNNYSDYIDQIRCYLETLAEDA